MPYRTESNKDVVLNSGAFGIRLPAGEVDHKVLTRGVAGYDYTSSSTALVITNQGSNYGGLNLETESAAAYRDRVIVGPAAAGAVLFDIVGVGGGSPTIINFHASFTATEQANLLAIFSGGIYDSTGFSFNKQTIIDNAIAVGIITDGIELTIESTVTYWGITSAVVSDDTDVFWTMPAYSLGTPGYSGPLTAGIQQGVLGIGAYRTERGSFGNTTIAAETTNIFYKYEGSGTPQTFIDGTAMSDAAFPNDTDHRFTAVGTDLLAVLKMEDAVTGLSTIGSFVAEWLDDDSDGGGGTPHASSYVRTNTFNPTAFVINAAGTVTPRLTIEVGTSYVVNPNPYLGSTWPPANHTIDVQHFPIGSGGFDISGTEVLSSGTDPITASISAGGTDASAALTHSGSNHLYFVDATVFGTGDYYYLVTGAVTGGTSTPQLIQGVSFRVQKY